MKGNRSGIFNMVKISMLVACLCISSFIVIPLPFTPIALTFHTIVVNIIALILKFKYAICTILVYLIMGLVGLPVFAGGTSGPGKLFGPMGGYYFGFLFAVILISLLKGKGNKFTRYVIVTIGLGIPAQHILAILFMCIHNGFNIPAAFLSVSLPFILGDIIKCVLASMVGVVLNKSFMYYEDMEVLN